MEMARNGGGASSAVAWGSAVLDTVSKFDRNSGRALHAYGISIDRCRSCRRRLMATGQTRCENCQYPRPAAATCVRCAKGVPSMWCYDCDACFCADCHAKPHVLVLGSKPAPPHNCFSVEGSSGKMLAQASWSTDFASMVKSIHGLRLKEKKKQHEAAASEERPEATDSVETTRSSGALVSNNGEKPNHQQQNQNQVDVESIAAQSSSVQNAVQPRQTQPSSAPAPAPSVSQQPVAPPTTSVTSAGPLTQQTSTPSSVTQATGATSTATSTTTTQPPMIQVTGASSSAPSISTTTATAAPATNQDQQEDSDSEVVFVSSRKRRLPATDRENLARPSPFASPSALVQRSAEAQAAATHLQTPVLPAPPAAAPTETIGRTLYEQVLLMNLRRDTQQQRAVAAPNTAAQPTSTPAPTVSTPASLPVPAGRDYSANPFARPANPAPVRLAQFVPSTSMATQMHTASIMAQSVFTSTSTGAMSVPSVPAPAPTPAPPRIPSPAPAPALAPPPMTTPQRSVSVDDNPLKIAMIDNYNKWNKETMKCEARLAELNRSVRQISFQNVALAANLNTKITHYRNQVDENAVRRDEALARVLMFSPSVLAHVRSMEARTFGDVPQVLKACHTKCAQLDGALQSQQQELDKLRAAIDQAIVSADLSNMSHLQAYGDAIQRVQQSMAQDYQERDKQFVIMMQFSASLRNTVMAMQQSS